MVSMLGLACNEDDLSLSAASGRDGGHSLNSPESTKVPLAGVSISAETSPAPASAEQSSGTIESNGGGPPGTNPKPDGKAPDRGVEPVDASVVEGIGGVSHGVGPGGGGPSGGVGAPLSTVAGDASTSRPTTGGWRSGLDAARPQSVVDASVPVDLDPPGSEGGASSEASTGEVRYVILISVDGLAPRFLQQLLDEGRVPAFHKLQQRSAWTHNARTDVSNTYTLPNHTSMLTGLPATITEGLPVTQAHGYLSNSTPGPSTTLHNSGNPNLSYVRSVFDVVHDHGLRTGLFASKSKFVVYTQSYNDAGAPDAVLPDDGARKIDEAIIDFDAATLTDALVATLQASPAAFSFVHWAQPDSTGHATSWGSDAYLDAVVAMDAQLDKVLTAIEQDAELDSHTAIVLTADHGGDGSSHGNSQLKNDFTIPFYLWVPSLPGNVDAYQVFPSSRYDPLDTNPPYTHAEQPLRNGDAANLSLRLLGLPTIDGSLMQPFLSRGAM